MVGLVVRALVPLVVVGVVPMNGQWCVGQIAYGMVEHMVVVVVEVVVGEPCGEQCSVHG